MVATKVETYQRPVSETSHYIWPPKNTNNEPLLGKIKQPTNTHKNNSIWIGSDWENKSINTSSSPKQLNKRFTNLVDSCSMEQVVLFSFLVTMTVPAGYKTDQEKDTQLEMSYFRRTEQKPQRINGKICLWKNN